ncbi:hypothetical protein C7M51_01331 [Mixta intestinalis]|uniref:Uncharacterized protein n=1 Tax=Mixta intestinalis TaxID=1615494 RepID=A0A6P1PYW4_9GAMM|nr:hypothetical protein C7M51_01331 [Mixta intestinalis]
MLWIVTAFLLWCIFGYIYNKIMDKNEEHQECYYD